MPDDDEHKEPASGDEDQARSQLPPAAQRALAEAEARRANTDAEVRPKEHGGRGGLEPTRYGDWEKDGIAHDF